MKPTETEQICSTEQELRLLRGDQGCRCRNKTSLASQTDLYY